MLIEFLSKEPSAEDRIEIAIARLTAMYVNRNSKEGSPRVEVDEYLPYRDAWAKSRYNEVDLSFLKHFG